MFYGCSKLQKMAVSYSGTITASHWQYWMNRVKSTGTFYYSKNQTKENIKSIVPSGWKLVQSTEWQRNPNKKREDTDKSSLFSFYINMIISSFQIASSNQP